MSQLRITTFADEVLDKIFAYLVDKGDWLALCKAHRSFKASGQRLLFCDIRIPAQHGAHSTGHCSILLWALSTASHLMDLVETLQIDCRLEDDGLVLERDAIRAILSKFQSLQHLIVFIVEQPQWYSKHWTTSFQVAHMLRNETIIKKIIINCPERRLLNIRGLFSLPPVTTLFESLRQVSSVNFKYLETIDFTAKVTAMTARRLGNAHKLEKLRSTWFNGNPLDHVDACIRGLFRTRHTLRKLTILPDAIYGGPTRGWRSADFSLLTDSKTLYVPSQAFFEEVSCSGLKRNPRCAELENRSDVTRLLSPNIQELELWFQYPSGIFATGGKYLRQFQELPEADQIRGFGWTLALLHLESLQKIRLSEVQCGHNDNISFVKGVGGWPTRKHTLPDTVRQAFLEAEAELEIEALELREWKLRCKFENHW
ncbi:hypothetical protein G6011_01952 [Alternaria panax]|uniref:Uncharacterized protein n=1 Tax=Alternaria panax TaxID=48097 RepID=A0AAD4FI68_9PLEO|nr:hypothetical protein G6011_01952 [Alternaria panax]